MQTLEIDRLEDFEALRDPWERVRSRAPHATVFDSWGWLRGRLEAGPDEWVVLAAVPGHREAPVAFFPLQVRWERTRFSLKVDKRVSLAGFPMSDQAGLLCIPEFASKALPELAGAVEAFMEQVGASRFEMRELVDSRWDDFLHHFGDDRFVVTSDEATPCPYIPLPESWVAYLQGSKKRKYLLRRGEREGFLITHVDEESLERDIEIFLDLHQRRLGPKPREYLATLGSIVRWTFRAGVLHLIVLWHEDTPAAVNVGFLDTSRRTFHAYNGGWDEGFRKYSPRRIAELHSIRYAIEHGCRTYDMGRGAEGYKFGFGAVEDFNRNVDLVRSTAYASAQRVLGRIPKRIAEGLKSASRPGPCPPPG